MAKKRPPNAEANQFRSGDEAVKNGKKGGVASGKARREKKALKETLNHILSMPLNDGELKNIEDIQSLTSTSGENISVQDAIVIKTVQMALKGNAKALKIMFDLMNTAGANAGTTQESDPLSKAFEELENV